MGYFTSVKTEVVDKIVYDNNGNNIDITATGAGKVFINGVEPGSGGSGGSPPISGQGDITITGNVTASGDGITTGKIESQVMKSLGNMVCDGNLEMPLGNIDLTTGNLSIPNTSSGGIAIAGTGGLSVNSGDITTGGNITGSGTNKITSGSGGIDSYGDIQTIGAHDLVIGNNIYFDGTDIFKRTQNPQVDTSYKIFKGLVARNDSTIWTGTNDFAEKVRLGTESGGTFTESGLTLNTNGTLQSVNINNTTLLQCGNINCGNGGTNEIRCKKIVTRTNEDDVNNPDGWIITQEAPSNPAQQIDRILDIQAQEANAYVTIRSSEPNQIVPSLVLNPRTSALGGEIIATSFRLGDGALTDWKIEQPKSGTDSVNLVITAGSGTNAKVKFKSDSGADLMFIEEATPGQGDGRIYLSDGIYFGVTGIHNSITESGNNLLIDQNNANSETQIRDNSNNPIISVRKTAVVLANNIPLNYGLFSTLPIQYKLNRTLTIAATPDTTTFTNMAFNCQSDTWTRVNDNTSVSMYNLLLEGYYKVTITQTGDSSAGNFIACDLMFDYVLHLSIQTAPDIDITEPSFNYRKKPTNQARPTIEIDHLNTPAQSQPVFVLYPNQSAGETMPIEVRLTKLDY